MELLDLVLIDVIILLVLLFLKVPLPFCFGGALAFLAITADVSMKSMVLWGFNMMISPVLLASPLFILSGNIIGTSGIADKLLDFSDIVFGKIRGGLGVISVMTCGIIGAISGSGFTGIAATGPVLIPRMTRKGYPLGYATAIVTISSVLGLLIPPSVIMIYYGWVTDTSILASFLSTLVPGLIVMFLFSVINIVWSARFNLKPEEKLPRKKQIARNGRVFINAIPALCLPIIILGGIYGGIFTPSEAAAVSIFVAVIVGVMVYKSLNGKTVVKIINNSAISIGAIMTMILFTLILSQIYTVARVPQTLVHILNNITDNTGIMLLLINFLLFLVGMIVNDVTGMILLAPLLLPVVIELGITPVHFAAIMGVNLAVGGVTPPYASILYLGMRIGNCEFHEILKPTLVFLTLGYIPVVLLTTFVPELSLYLPRLFGLIKY